MNCQARGTGHRVPEHARVRADAQELIHDRPGEIPGGGLPTPAVHQPDAARVRGGVLVRGVHEHVRIGGRAARPAGGVPAAGRRQVDPSRGGQSHAARGPRRTARAGVAPSVLPRASFAPYLLGKSADPYRCCRANIDHVVGHWFGQVSRTMLSSWRTISHHPRRPAGRPGRRPGEPAARGACGSRRQRVYFTAAGSAELAGARRFTDEAAQGPAARLVFAAPAVGDGDEGHPAQGPVLHGRQEQSR